ncbi:MAG TPA: type II toxin-antitoxin system RelE/ParE family toxin [Acidobacteriaceae bacterium]|nr:type II toxin-antitoxin system RelE/ParE family toxin [Acidobacteriaceae bacterium]
MQIKQRRQFRQELRRMTSTMRQEVDNAVRVVINDPDVGKPLKGALAGLRALRFQLNRSEARLIYRHEPDSTRIVLVYLGPWRTSIESWTGET